MKEKDSTIERKLHAQLRKAESEICELSTTGDEPEVVEVHYNKTNMNDFNLQISLFLKFDDIYFMATIFCVHGLRKCFLGYDIWR